MVRTTLMNIKVTKYVSGKKIQNMKVIINKQY